MESMLRLPNIDLQKDQLGDLDHFGFYATDLFHLFKFSGKKDFEHEGLELFFALSHKPTVQISQTKFIVDPSKIIVFNALEPHRIQESNGSFFGITIYFHMISEILQDLGFEQNSFSFQESEILIKPDIHQFLLKMISARWTHNPDKMFYDSLITSFLVKILQNYKNSVRDKILHLANFGKFPDHITRIKSVIYDHACLPNIGLNEIAKGAGLSKFHLVRIFKDATGFTPVQYRNRIRIETAKHQLISSQKSIMNIAFDVGFEDLSSFNKAFLRITNLSPSAYRKIAINS